MLLAQLYVLIIIHNLECYRLQMQEEVSLAHLDQEVTAFGITNKKYFLIQTSGMELSLEYKLIPVQLQLNALALIAV